MEMFSRKTAAKGRRVKFTKKYICQLSADHKTASSRRDKTCTAFVLLRLLVKPLKCSKKLHPLVFDGYLGEVTISWHHNHPTVNLEPLQYLRLHTSVKQTAMRLFQEGLTPAGVKQILQDRLIDEDEGQGEFTVDFYDHHLNPSYHQLHHIFAVWRQEHCGLDETSMISALQARAQELAQQGYNISSHAEDPLICCFTSPIMRRAAALPSATELIFVDSTSTVDATGVTVTFMLTATLAGAVPLCVLLHRGQSEETYVKAFLLAKEVMREPVVFMTDDSSAERNALHTVFPQSTLLLCIFHRAQATWRWLSDAKHGIPKERRQELMAQYSQLMRAETEYEAENYMDVLRVTIAYPKYKDYLENQWEERREWVLAFRHDLPMRGNNTNNYAEATIRIVKDIILCRQKSFNLIAFLVFFSETFEKYLRARIMNAVLPVSNIMSRKHRKAVAKAQEITDESIVAGAVSGMYVVSSSSGNVYNVDIQRGFCDCHVGSSGACCKHQLAAANKEAAALPNIPVVSTPEQKIDLCNLALGPNGLGSTGAIFFGSVTTEPCEIAAADRHHGTTEASLQQNSLLTHQVEIQTDRHAVELTADDMEERDRAAVMFQQLLDQTKGITSGDDPMLQALKRFNKTFCGRKATPELINTWCNRATSLKHQRVIRTQPTASGRRKCAYKGRRSLNCSQIRSHKLAQAIRANVAPAKKH